MPYIIYSDDVRTIFQELSSPLGPLSDGDELQRDSVNEKINIYLREAKID